MIRCVQREPGMISCKRIANSGKRNHLREVQYIQLKIDGVRVPKPRRLAYPTRPWSKDRC